MIYRYPRYGELFDAWQKSGASPQRARRLFGPQDFRDLQVLSQVAWFDEDIPGERSRGEGPDRQGARATRSKIRR